MRDLIYIMEDNHPNISYSRKGNRFDSFKDKFRFFNTYKRLQYILPAILVLTLVGVTVLQVQQRQDVRQYAAENVASGNESVSQLSASIEEKNQTLKNPNKKTSGVRTQSDSQIASSDELKNIARTRKEDMLKLLEKDPSQFFSRTLSSQEREALPTDVQNDIEKDTTIQGTYAIKHEDSFDPKIQNIKDTDALISKDGKTYTLYSSKKIRTLKLRSEMTVKGINLGDHIAVRNADTDIQISSGTQTSQGQQVKGISTSNTLAIIILKHQFSDAFPPPNATFLQDLIFGSAPAGVNQYYKEQSWGQYSYTGQVYGPITINSTRNTCSVGDWAAQADQLLAAQGITLSTNVIKVYVWSDNMCSYAGGTIMGGNIVFIDGDGSQLGSVYSHELGHIIGFGHASTDSAEYGDCYDVMGCAGNFHHMHVLRKLQAGWLPQDAVQTITMPDTYTLEPADKPGVGFKKLLKIQKDQNTAYYVEYRQNYGVFDSLVSYQGTTDMKVYVGDSDTTTPGNRPTYYKNPTSNTFTDQTLGLTIQSQYQDTNIMKVAVSMTGGCVIRAFPAGGSSTGKTFSAEVSWLPSNLPPPTVTWYVDSQLYPTDGSFFQASLSPAIPYGIHNVSANIIFPGGQTVNCSGAVDLGETPPPTPTQTPTYTVSGTVFHDANNNQQQDSGERPLASIPMQLSNGQSVLTDAQGRYSITTNSGQYTIFLNSTDVRATGTNPVAFNLTGNTTLNFGATLTSIRGLVWLDQGTNNQNPAAHGYAGALITLMRSGMTPQTTTSGPDGMYRFYNLTNGSYTVTITPPLGYRTTVSNPATINLAQQYDFVNFNLQPVPNTPPTGNITGPTSIGLGNSGSYTATLINSTSNISAIRIYTRKQGNPNPDVDWVLLGENTSCGGSRCSLTTQWTPSETGTYWVVVNGTDAAGGRCTGNPFYAQPNPTWPYCGSASTLTVQVVNPVTCSLSTLANDTKSFIGTVAITKNGTPTINSISWSLDGEAYTNTTSTVLSKTYTNLIAGSAHSLSARVTFNTNQIANCGTKQIQLPSLSAYFSKPASDGYQMPTNSFPIEVQASSVTSIKSISISLDNSSIPLKSCAGGSLCNLYYQAPRNLSAGTHTLSALIIDNANRTLTIRRSVKK